MKRGDDTRTQTLFTDRDGALRARRFRISIVAGPDQGRRIDAGEGTILVGTHRNADLLLTDKNVSRYHLEAQPSEAGLRLTDLESTNGSFLGDVRLGSVVVTGDVLVRLGSTTTLSIEAYDAAVPLGLYGKDRFGPLLGASATMRQMFGLLERVASSDATVLLEGETGTGKELVAEAIHAASKRCDGPLVFVDCATLPRDLTSAELFGNVRGAFTDAHESKRGLVRSADRGTLVLDEIGELPIDMQSQLLRVLEKREVRAVGDSKSTKVDVRVVAATNRNLAAEVRAGTFREDLFFRIAVVRVTVPALRKRREDIPLLARNFLHEIGRDDFVFSPEMLTLMMSYDWPGNVRELRNVLERGVSLQFDLLDLPGAELGVGTNETDAAPSSMVFDATTNVRFKEAKNQLLHSFEREYLTYLLARNQGNLTRAAAEAGIDRNYIRRLAKKHGLGTK